MFDPTQHHWLQTPQPLAGPRPTVRSVLAGNKRATVGGLLLGAVFVVLALGALVIL